MFEGKKVEILQLDE